MTKGLENSLKKVSAKFPSSNDLSKALLGRDCVLLYVQFGEPERARRVARQIGHIWLPYLKERWHAELPPLEQETSDDQS